MKTVSKFILGAAIVLFGASAALAQQPTTGDKDPSGYGAWDPNADEQIDESEFSTGFGNGDYYSQWDANQDNQIDETEWNDGFSTTYPDAEYDGVYSDWDTNGDSYLDNDEFTAGTFSTWDENGDGYIDSDEYKTWNRNDNGGGR